MRTFVTISKEFWDRKSKAPFFWGPGDGNAFEWIGFVGYEVRYTGEVHLRLSTLNKKFGAINKRYHTCILTKTPKDFNGIEVNHSVFIGNSINRNNRHRLLPLTGIINSVDCGVIVKSFHTFLYQIQGFHNLREILVYPLVGNIESYSPIGGNEY